MRGKLQRNRERITVRGLNRNHNHDVKNLLKGAAISALQRPGPLQDFYAALVEKGMRPSMARLTLARKIAAITFNHVEERSEFRPQTVAATSSLSISGEEQPSIRRVPSAIG